ncbi:hypothetical protein WDW86_09440 [Bdellovibrionota bacterium FG-2]
MARFRKAFSQKSMVLFVSAITVFTWASGCGKNTSKDLLVSLGISRGGAADTSAATAGDSASPSPSASVSSSPSESPSDSATTASPLPSELIGTWTSRCTGSGNTYQITEYTFDSSSGFSGGNRKYSDSACTALTQNRTGSGTLTLGAAVSSGPRNIDFVASFYPYNIFELMDDVLYINENPASSAATRPTSVQTALYKSGGSVSPLTLANLVGNWSTSNCLFGNENAYYTDSYVIEADGHFTYSYNRFTESTCTTPGVPATGTGSGNLSIGTTYNWGDAARKIDFTIPAGGAFSAAASYNYFELTNSTTLYFGSMKTVPDNRDSAPALTNRDIAYTKTLAP